ncbi:hypothetical protein EKO27_g3262 [Xylaria grammica]|uniref:RING-type domain-containing protein n=1 Tax=Xylaria grammica TaxID=363999 RepID=A0A439DBR3_9PEZI|nr:hypothetical protein EKO27_g3262 [Xylaria grammica]
MSCNNNADKGQLAKDFDEPATVVGEEVVAYANGGTPARVAEEPRVVTDIAIWSELSKYITAYNPTALKDIGSNASVQVQLDCGICFAKRLLLPAWIDHDHQHLKSTQESSEQVCVLPCGHFFGDECITAWVKYGSHGDKPPTCPSCRFELVHPMCKHPIELAKIPVELSAENPKDIVRHVPYTRVHQLKPGDQTTFVDVSGWGPDDVDTTNDFSVTDECCPC